MLLQERVNVCKVPDVPGKTIQLIDYQDIAEATLYKRQHALQIRPGRIRTSEVFIRELLPGITWPENFDSQYSRFIRN